MPGNDAPPSKPPDDSASGADAGGASGGAGPNDRRLIERMLSGDEDAVRLLVERYDRLIRYTVFKTGRRQCTRDPGWLDARANEAWTGIVGALRRRGRASIPPNIPAYFARIARNKSLDAVDRGNDQPVYSLDSGDGGRSRSDEQASTDMDPHALLEGVEELSVLRDCIARLSEDEQVICSEIGLILDRRWREAAGRLDMAESTLRSRWGHILDKLRACLEKKSEKKFRA